MSASQPDRAIATDESKTFTDTFKTDIGAAFGRIDAPSLINLTIDSKLTELLDPQLKGDDPRGFVERICVAVACLLARNARRSFLTFKYTGVACNAIMKVIADADGRTVENLSQDIFGSQAFADRFTRALCLVLILLGPVRSIKVLSKDWKKSKGVASSEDLCTVIGRALDRLYADISDEKWVEQANVSSPDRYALPTVLEIGQRGGWFELPPPWVRAAFTTVLSYTGLVDEADHGTAFNKLMVQRTVDIQKVLTASMTVITDQDPSQETPAAAGAVSQVPASQIVRREGGFTQPAASESAEEEDEDGLSIDSDDLRVESAVESQAEAPERLASEPVTPSLQSEPVPPSGKDRSLAALVAGTQKQAALDRKRSQRGALSGAPNRPWGVRRVFPPRSGARAPTSGSEHFDPFETHGQRAGRDDASLGIDAKNESDGIHPASLKRVERPKNFRDRSYYRSSQTGEWKAPLHTGRGVSSTPPSQDEFEHESDHATDDWDTASSLGGGRRNRAHGSPNAHLVDDLLDKLTNLLRVDGPFMTEQSRTTVKQVYSYLCS